MKNILLLGAIGALLPTGAMAADLASVPVPVADPPACAANWDRTYVGAQVGAASMLSNWTIGGIPFAPTEAKLTDSGLVAGVFVGHDKQFDGFILGAEADFNFLDLADSEEYVSLGEGLTIHASVNALGSLRARVGIPVDCLLFYVTAGVAVGTANVGYEADSIYLSGSDSHDLRLGGVIGAGVEAMVTDNVGLRLQGLYYNFGSHDFDGTDISADMSAAALTVGVTWKF
jgi:outer membrane immunogenic protein